MEQATIKIENLSFSYPDFLQKGKKIFNSLNLELKSGILYVITGSSGSGKTTLLRLLKGIYKTKIGTITFIPKNLKKFIYLIPSIDALFFLTNNVRQEIKNALDESLLKIFHFPEEYLNFKIDDLSDGYKILLSVIIAYTSGAKVYLFDDVTTVLDISFITIFKKVITVLTQRGFIVIVATNEYDKFIGLNTIFLKINGGEFHLYSPQGSYYRMIKNAN